MVQLLCCDHELIILEFKKSNSIKNHFNGWLDQHPRKNMSAIAGIYVSISQWALPLKEIFGMIS